MLFRSCVVETNNQYVMITRHWPGGSVTRLGDLLHFRQLFKACGNNYFAQIAHIFRQFL